MSNVLFWVRAEGYLEFDDCCLVIVEVAVVGSGEDGDDCRELLLAAPVVHLESIGLRLVGSDDGEQ